MGAREVMAPSHFNKLLTEKISDIAFQPQKAKDIFKNPEFSKEMSEQIEFFKTDPEFKQRFNEEYEKGME